MHFNFFVLDIKNLDMQVGYYWKAGQVRLGSFFLKLFKKLEPKQHKQQIIKL